MLLPCCLSAYLSNPDTRFCTDTKGIDRLILTNFDGTLTTMLFDENKVSLVPDTQPKLTIESQSIIPPFHVEVSRFDKEMLMVLQKKVAAVRFFDYWDD